MRIIITCEHASNNIPTAYASLFKDHQAVLKTHRGYDIGALDLAKRMVAKWADYHQFARCSRLLVDLNRSMGHPHLFSEITRLLSRDEKTKILKNYYLPYRNRVEAVIADYISHSQKVLHLSIHSFTPVLGNQRRHNDFGLLYDSRRAAEKRFCQEWKQAILRIDPAIKLRFNYPYLGKMDGFVTYLRRRFSQKSYIGIEVEINQQLFVRTTTVKANKIDQLIQSFSNLLRTIE